MRVLSSQFLHGTASLRLNEVERLPHWWDDASVVPPSALAAVTFGGRPNSLVAPPRAMSMASLGPAETGSVDDLAALPQLAGKKPGGLRRSVSAPSVPSDLFEVATVVTIASSGTTPREEAPPECAGGLVRRLSRMCVGASDKPKASPVTSLKRHVPIRIEPKTFFANERTLLQWLHISILILFTALSLVTSDSMMGGANGSGSWASDYNSRLAGAVMAPVSVIFIIYALVTYMWRAHRIARREPTARYDDRFGPCILVLLLLAVTITSIVLAIAHADWHREGSPPVTVVNKFKSVTTAGPPLPGGAATNKSRAASLLRLDVNGRDACGQVHVAWPPFFRPRGVTMGPGDTLLVGSDYALAAVPLLSAGAMSGGVQVWPATDVSLTAVAATPSGDVFLGSSRPRNGLALYDVAARAVSHATSLDGDTLLGATQALTALAIGPNRTLLVAGSSGVEVLAVNVTRGNASAPLDWAAFRHLDGDALAIGLQGSAHIASMAYHEPSAALLLMFDKAKPPTVRAWNMTSGQLVGDWPLPSTADGDDGSAASQAAQPAAPGTTWAGLALGRNGTSLLVVSASPPQLWRLQLGADMLPTCIL